MTAQKTELDDVMLAMDVVDTLRHSSRIIERELSADIQDQNLLGRLRHIYSSQGIEVPDHILQEGVNALREDRFTYVPTPRTLSRRLAELYVKIRFRWKYVFIIFAAIYLPYLILSNTTQWTPAAREVAEKRKQVAIVQMLPDQFEGMYARIDALSDDPQIEKRARDLVNSGMAAVMVMDTEAALADKDALEKMAHTLSLEYYLRIVSGPGSTSGVWRVPDDNPNARNYYIIVEPVAEDGRTTSISIISEENNSAQMVKKFGVRVPEATFNAILQDKQDDGIIQQNILGKKPRGALEASYNVPVLDGFITEWDE